MKKIHISASLAVGVLSVACAASLHAQVTAAIGGEAQSGANYVNFDNIGSGTYTSGALTVSFAGQAGEDATGSSAPWLSGNNNVNFETPSTLGSGGQADSTPFIATGSAGAGNTITFNFSSPENYFGLLWGSVDNGPSGGASGNLLTFWSGPNGTGTQIETVAGSDIESLIPSMPDGNIGIDGTAYVNIDTTSTFESIVASSGITTFEIDNVAYSGPVSGVPDGCATLGLLGGAMTTLQAIRRKLNCQA